jgi:hypothetical protein
VTLAFGVPRPAALWRTRVDSGTFAVTIAGKRAGQEIFEIIDVGLGSSLDVRTRSTLALPGGVPSSCCRVRVLPACEVFRIGQGGDPFVQSRCHLVFTEVDGARVIAEVYRYRTRLT